MDKPFFHEYFGKFCDALQSADEALLEKATELIVRCNLNGGKVLIAGNGGSASIAGHVAIDLTKAARISAMCFNEASLITCFSNDFGYEHWVEKSLEYYAGANDLVILISSSGKSPNMLNAARKALEMRLPVITLTGFDAANPLRLLGSVNLWIESNSYNIVENVHQIWLLSISDKLASKVNNS